MQNQLLASILKRCFFDEEVGESFTYAVRYSRRRGRLVEEAGSETDKFVSAF